MEGVPKRWVDFLRNIFASSSQSFFEEFYYCDLKTVVDSILCETKVTSFAIFSSYCKAETGNVILKLANPHNIPISVVCVALMFSIPRHSFPIMAISNSVNFKSQNSTAGMAIDENSGSWKSASWEAL